MGKPIPDLRGLVVGRLTVIGLSGKKSGGRAYWLCRCDCGNTKETNTYLLTSKQTQSCGCLQKQVRLANVTTHGMTGTATHRAWKAMMTRCTNPRQVCYKNYGGRGIGVSREFLSFEKFYAVMGDRPAGMTLERIDNNKGYGVGNVRWATRKEQMWNTRRNAILTINGETMPLAAWCERYGITQGTYYSRRRDGLSKEECITRPLYAHQRGLLKT